MQFYNRKTGLLINPDLVIMNDGLIDYVVDVYPVAVTRDEGSEEDQAHFLMGDGDELSKVPALKNWDDVEVLNFTPFTDMNGQQIHYGNVILLSYYLVGKDGVRTPHHTVYIAKHSDFDGFCLSFFEDPANKDSLFMPRTMMFDNGRGYLTINRESGHSNNLAIEGITLNTVLLNSIPDNKVILGSHVFIQLS